jgi:hypothetical protein
MTQSATVHHYFVDEAGDLTLSNKRGQVMIGRPGVSRVFMVGVAHLPDPRRVRRVLDETRAALVGDPYFKNVPSMRPEASKTAICFHANDDLPEVRREVFKVLPDFGAKVQVAIRRKIDIATEARLAWRRFGRKLTGHHVYDDLVKRPFKNLLHKAAQNRITFARRGKSDREAALTQALDKARRNFEAKWGVHIDRPTWVHSAYPSECPGLQVIDYYLWALQRLYERAEDRFYRLLAGQYRLIMDLDDTRNRPYGEWYSDSNPLELSKLKPVAG